MGERAGPSGSKQPGHDGYGYNVQSDLCITAKTRRNTSWSSGLNFYSDQQPNQPPSAERSLTYQETPTGGSECP
ncbi:hypothetical protein GDO81_027672 [Engystomops pustulosus]|uniref:Uncharacterized protein n=1 Tax=Engystomops pustulosus TaxID=76066 RepID=A0AAV6YI67_ENGPU|nr:hypothetical protein GDO81_027672 [Engystomops pustulosus]